MKPPVIHLEVHEADDGQRIDVFLVGREVGVGRRGVRALFEEGEVRINGKRAKKGDRVHTGDQVELREPSPRDFAALPDGAAVLPILFEDDVVVVANKPAGMPSAPLRADEIGTAASALLARYPEMAGAGYSPREPGIVHRLDTETSGVLLAARSQDAFERLRDALKAHEVEKHYIALCQGRAIAGEVVDAPIASHPSDPRRVVVSLDGRLAAKPARTELLEVTAIGADYSLVVVSASAARRHQVRAHLAAIGHPLAGDTIYGGPVIEGLARHFLHASRIAFDHPSTRARIVVESPLPSELVETLERLRA